MVARKKDEIPENFNSIEDAAQFWDTHSLADYHDQTKAIGMDFQITKRMRYIAVPENIYKKLAQKANQKHQTIRKMVYDLAK